jgi:Tfp pilus assembly protein FimT
MLQGLQFARTEAIRRNRQICFDWSGIGTGWVVAANCVDAPGSIPTSKIIQSQPNREGSVASVVAMLPATAQRVTFNGYGRVIPNTVGGASITQIDITSTAARMQRRILVSAGDSSGRVFVCDPAAVANTQMSCS